MRVPPIGDGVFTCSRPVALMADVKIVALSGLNPLHGLKNKIREPLATYAGHLDKGQSAVRFAKKFLDRWQKRC